MTRDDVKRAIDAELTRWSLRFDDLDSLDLVELQMECEDRYGAPMKDLKGLHVGMTEEEFISAVMDSVR
jgi:acyl carrier protein